MQNLSQSYINEFNKLQDQTQYWNENVAHVQIISKNQ